MLCITDNRRDPAFNLAAEEYLLKNFSCPVFRLWRNDPSVIVGKNQNALAEIDIDYVKANGIPVIRRLSGGGAVFHDPGNINFTFIDRKAAAEETNAIFRRFTAPILDFLRTLGVEAALSGRNDLCIGERKFSGNAVCLWRDRVLLHGTLLFDVSMNSLSKALLSRPEKYSDKAVKSNVSRVTNILSHLEEKMDVEEFIDRLNRFVVEGTGGTDVEARGFTAEESAAIEALADGRYRQESWNFGASPKYGFSRIRKFPCGLVELYMKVEKGIICDLDIRGDYFFSAPTGEFCRHMEGCSHTKEEIAERISAISFSDYFNGISLDELTGLFF